MIPGVYLGLGRDPNLVLLATSTSGIEAATQMEAARQSATREGHMQRKL